MIRTYSELMRIPTFKERFNYLKLSGSVGIETFGFDRYLNQVFYKSDEWKEAKRLVILRSSNDDIVGDMGDLDYPINGRIIVHHMNPISEKDILDRNPAIIDPEFLIPVSINTHNAIHYSDESILFTGIVERKPNDTIPWRL